MTADKRTDEQPVSMAKLLQLQYCMSLQKGDLLQFCLPIQLLKAKELTEKEMVTMFSVGSEKRPIKDTSSQANRVFLQLICSLSPIREARQTIYMTLADTAEGRTTAEERINKAKYNLSSH